MKFRKLIPLFLMLVVSIQYLPLQRITVCLSQHAHLKNIVVEIKKSRFKAGHQLVHDQSTIHEYALASIH